MKEKIHYAIEAALAVAVIILFALFFSGKNISSTIKEVVSNEEQVSEHISIAYIELETLMSNYTFSIDLNEILAKEYENSMAKLTEQGRKFAGEVEEYKRKAEMSAFLTRERQINEEQRLAKKQEDLQKMEVQLSQEFSEKQARMNEIMRQTIIAQLVEFNKDKGYHFIFGKMTDNILLTNDTYNITTDAIDFLNRHYTTNEALLKSQLGIKN